MTSMPLFGRRVLVTRAANQAGKLCEGLQALGATSIEVPVLEIRAPESFERFDAALRNLDTYNSLILTSANAARAIVERIAALKIIAPAHGLQIAAIGSGTAEAARNAGMIVTVVPENYLAESLVSTLQSDISGKRVLVARAATARDVIPDALRAAGATVDVVDAYQNVVPEAASVQLRRAFSQNIDAATFTSSSSATHLAEAAREAGIGWPFEDVSAISIGPITSKTLRELGWPPAAEANPHDIPGLIAAVSKLLSKS